jgi:hypothetical protein
MTFAPSDGGTVVRFRAYGSPRGRCGSRRQFSDHCATRKRVLEAA